MAVRHRPREQPRQAHAPRIRGLAVRETCTRHAVLTAARRVFIATQRPYAPRKLNRAQHDAPTAGTREVDTLAHRLLAGAPANLERLATFEDQTEPECWTPAIRKRARPRRSLPGLFSEGRARSL